MRTVSVKLMADAADFNRNVRGAGASVKGLAQDLDRANKAGNLDHVTDAAAGLGLGLVGVAGIAVKFAMDFDKQMSSVKAATHASAGEMDQLRKASLQAGKDTAFSATEAAKGVEELAKAGVSTSDILSGGLKGALDLAAAGELDVGAAAETAASALTQFKLSGKDVPHVADLLSAAAGKAQGSVADMGAALNQAGLIAAGTGLSIEDTTGTLAAFASAGLLGSDAGTSFKTMLQAVQAPSGKTKELMDELGISAYDAAGNFIGIANFAQQLKEQLHDLTPEVRANAMAQIFGSDATRAASILYEQGAAGIQEWIKKTNDAGFAAETAAIKTDNLAGDLERLKGSLETAAIESGGGLNQGLRVLTKSADALVGTIDKLPSGTTAVITALAAVGGVLTLGLVAWMKSRAAMASVVAELNAVGPAGAKAAVGLQAASKWAGRAAIAFVGLEVAGAVFDKLGNGAVNVNKLTAALQDYATTGKMTEGLTENFGKNLEEFGLIAQSAEAATHGFWGGLNDLLTPIPLVGSAVDSMNESLYGTSFNDATERMKALDESFTAFIGTQKDAKAAGDLWNQMILKSGLETDQLAKLLPNTWAGLGELQKAAHGGAVAQGELAGESQASADALAKQEAALAELEKTFKDVFGAYMTADQAAMKYRETLIGTNKELENGKRSLAESSEEGRKNRTAVLEQIDAVNDMRTANVNNDMAVDKADATYRKQIDTLKKNLLQLGYNEEEVAALIDKYRAIPEKVGTSVETPGLPKAAAGIKGYQTQLDNIATDIKTNVSVEGDRAAYAKLEKLLVAQQAATKGISISAAQSAFNKNAKGFHDGGRTPGGEYEPAGIVHGQEVVLNARTVRAVDQQAPGFIDEVLATGQLPGYRGGGRVLSMPFPVNVARTLIPSMAEAMAKVAPAFSRDWPSSPSAQRGDSGIWHDVVRLIKSGPHSGHFGNAYRPGDPKWHGSGRAVDWMGYNQDPLARFLAARRPLELIHRTRERDYAYTRGVNKGSFNNALMEAHRNHIHIAMGNGGVINEHVVGVGLSSGASYEFGERGIPETVTPGYLPSSAGGGAATVTYVIQLTNAGVIGSQYELDNWLTRSANRLEQRGRT